VLFSMFSIYNSDSYANKHKCYDIFHRKNGLTEKYSRHYHAKNRNRKRKHCNLSHRIIF